MKNLIEEREEWVRYLRVSLLQQVQIRGRSQRVLEEKNDFQRGYLSQVLNGRIQLTARHVFGLLLALDVKPADFFVDLFREHGMAKQIAEICDRLERLEYDAAHGSDRSQSQDANGVVVIEGAGEVEESPEVEDDPSSKK